MSLRAAVRQSPDPFEVIERIESNLPQELRNLPVWLLHRKKQPFYADGTPRRGKLDSAADRAKLVTYEEIVTALLIHGADGIGVALGPVPGTDIVLSGIDLDHCYVAGQLEERAAAILTAAKSYAEKSPSGEGLHILGLGHIGTTKMHPGPVGLEIYSAGRYFTVTGNVIKDAGLANLAEVATLGRRLFGGVPSRTTAQPPSQDSHRSIATPNGLRFLEQALGKRDANCGYDEWIRVGMALHHESSGSEDGFRVWHEWSKRGTKKYSSADDLRMHWNSFSSAVGKNVVTGGSILRDDTASADEFGTESAARSRRFVAIRDDQFIDRAPLSWHIKGVLPRAELAMLYGPSGSGKSFLAFDIVAAVATGSSWYGRRTAKGRVVYIVAEGATGFLNRLKAYAKAHSGTFPGIRIIADAPNLLGEADPVSLATEIEATGGADVIVIDTLAVCSPGADENAAKDMGRVIEHCKQLHKATGATVLLVHHSGKDDSKGARGWSGLRAAADAEIEVSRYADHRTAAVTKMKDGEDGAEFAFKLVPVEMGVDSDGDPITSCVVEQLPVVPKGSRKEPRPGTVERTLLDSIRDNPSADQQVSVSGAIDAAMPLLPQPQGRDTRRQHLMRALRTLASKGFITVEGDVCRML